MSCYETEVVFPIYGNRLCPQKKMESVCFKGILLVVFMESSDQGLHHIPWAIFFWAFHTLELCQVSSSFRQQLRRRRYMLPRQIQTVCWLLVPPAQRHGAPLRFGGQRLIQGLDESLVRSAPLSPSLAWRLLFACLVVAVGSFLGFYC